MRDTAPGLVAVTYENDEGDVIYFDYSFIHQGAQTDFIFAQGDTVFDVMVNQQAGKFFKSNISGNQNTLTWIDLDLNIHFSLDGCFDLKEILHMAESISLCKITN